MDDQKQRQTLAHPVFGALPARRILECVFALSPDGPILHHHLEEVDTSERDGAVLYTLTGHAPADGRERCQIIPPLVREFDGA